ncbi:MAG: ECF transporter S component [Chloroflexota bacterium]
MNTPIVGSATASRTRNADRHWRTRDILVAAIIGVAFGVVFWVWGLAWSAFEPLNAIFPVTRDLLYAVWLVPAVLAPLVIQKPGAAIFAEMVAAGVSALLGGIWGFDTLLSGFLQGAAAEIVFAVALYRTFSLPVLGAAAVASAAAAWIHDWVLYYPGVATDVQIARGIAMGISAFVIVALGSRALARSLRRSGVLDGFPG